MWGFGAFPNFPIMTAVTNIPLYKANCSKKATLARVKKNGSFHVPFFLDVTSCRNPNFVC